MKKTSETSGWVFAYASLMTLLFSVFLILYSNSSAIVFELKKKLAEATGEESKKLKVEKDLVSLAERIGADFLELKDILLVPEVEISDLGVRLKFSEGFEASSEKPTEKLKKSLERLKRHLFSVTQNVRVESRVKRNEVNELRDERGYRLATSRAAAAAQILTFPLREGDPAGVGEESEVRVERFEAVGQITDQVSGDLPRLEIWVKSKRVKN